VNWMTLLYLLLAGLMAWFAWRMIRNNPNLFSKENIGNSFSTMALLALGLIVFIALLVFLLKNG